MLALVRRRLVMATIVVRILVGANLKTIAALEARRPARTARQPAAVSPRALAWTNAVALGLSGSPQPCGRPG